MNVSDKLHAPAALFSEKKPPVLLGWEALWSPEPVWRGGEEEKYIFFAPAGNRTPVV
jgi:hypothetical protein